MRLLAVVVAFSSFSAFAACPNLAGKYSACRSTSGTMSGSNDVVVTQKVKNGITTYTITSTDDESQERSTEELIADGKTRTTKETDPDMGEIVSTSTYSCSGVKVVGKQTMSVQGEILMDMTQEIQKKNATVEIDMYGNAFGQEMQDTLICE